MSEINNPKERIKSAFRKAVFAAMHARGSEYKYFRTNLENGDVLVLMHRDAYHAPMIEDRNFVVAYGRYSPGNPNEGFQRGYSLVHQVFYEEFNESFDAFYKAIESEDPSSF